MRENNMQKLSLIFLECLLTNDNFQSIFSYYVKHIKYQIEVCEVTGQCGL